MAELRDRTKCVTVIGREAPVDVVSMRVGDGDPVEIEGVSLRALHTPGHTAESYSFAMEDRVFTGDTLLIRGTGRTDFQNGDPLQQYDSLFTKLLTLPDETLVYPGHDYKGDTVSTIGEEKRFNPRLQVTSPADYEALMKGLNLANPKMMDVAVPANLQVGRGQEDEAHPECAMTAQEVMHGQRPDDILVDLREDGERGREGAIPNSIHAPYGQLTGMIGPGGALRALAGRPGHRLVYYCAFGERSAMAVESSRESGLGNVCHMNRRNRRLAGRRRHDRGMLIPPPPRPAPGACSAPSLRVSVLREPRAFSVSHGNALARIAHGSRPAARCPPRGAPL